MKSNSPPAGKGPHRDPAGERSWRRLLKQFAACGQSVREFCSSRGLSESSIYAWRRTLERRDSQTASRRLQCPEFVELRPQQPTSGSDEGEAPLEIVAGDRRLLIRGGCDRDLLRTSLPCWGAEVLVLPMNMALATPKSDILTRWGLHGVGTGRVRCGSSSFAQADVNMSYGFCGAVSSGICGRWVGGGAGQVRGRGSQRLRFCPVHPGKATYTACDQWGRWQTFRKGPGTHPSGAHALIPIHIILALPHLCGININGEQRAGPCGERTLV